jgi:hypothetical protein
MTVSASTWTVSSRKTTRCARRDRSYASVNQSGAGFPGSQQMWNVTIAEADIRLSFDQPRFSPLCAKFETSAQLGFPPDLPACAGPLSPHPKGVIQLALGTPLILSERCHVATSRNSDFGQQKTRRSGRGWWARGCPPLSEHSITQAPIIQSRCGVSRSSQRRPQRKLSQHRRSIQHALDKFANQLTIRLQKSRLAGLL